MDASLLRPCLMEMARNGISVQLTWGEDTGIWECHWIDADDIHVSGLGKTPERAVEQCLNRAGLDAIAVAVQAVREDQQ